MDKSANLTPYESHGATRTDDDDDDDDDMCKSNDNANKPMSKRDLKKNKHANSFSS